MLLLEAEDLLAQVLIDVRVGVSRGAGGVGVVDRVDTVECVRPPDGVIEARGAEVFANMLGRGADVLGDASGHDQRSRGIQLGDLRTVRDRPEIQELCRDRAERGWCVDAGIRVWDLAQARLIVRHQGNDGLAQVLAIAFIVAEEEELVLLDGPAQRRAEVVALKLGNAGAVEVVASIKEAVAEELIHTAVERVGAAGGGDGYLGSVALAVRGRVRVGDDIELVNAIDPEELAGGSAGGGVDERCAGVLDPIEQEEIVLRAAAGGGEHAAYRGVRGSYTAGTLVGVVHRCRIQQKQLIVAASVERELLDLACIDQAGYLVGGDIDGGGNVPHGDGFAAGDADRQGQVEGLTDGERDAGAFVGGEAAGVDADGVVPDGHGRGGKRANAAGCERALYTGVVVVNHDFGVGDDRATGISHSAGDGAADHLGRGVDRQGKESGKEEETGQVGAGRAVHAVLLRCGARGFAAN